MLESICTSVVLQRQHVIYLGSARKPPLPDALMFLGSARILSVSLTNKAKMHRAQMLRVDIKHELYPWKLYRMRRMPILTMQGRQQHFSSTESHSKITCVFVMAYVTLSTMIATQGLQIVRSHQKTKYASFIPDKHTNMFTAILAMHFALDFVFISPLRFQHSITALDLFSAMLVHTVCGV